MNSFAPALLTDHYELTMISAALKDGTAHRPSVFEVFARRLPAGRRYGVAAGQGRLMDLVRDFRFTGDLAQHPHLVDGERRHALSAVASEHPSNSPPAQARSTVAHKP